MTTIGRKRIRYHSSPVLGRVVSAGIRLSALPLSLVDYRGLYRISRFLGRLCPKSHFIVELDDSRLRIDCNDPYWMQFLPSERIYERQLLDAFVPVSDRKGVVFDLGANIGYWATLLSSSRFPSWRVVAVEAAPDTYERLRRNSALNDDRFVCLNRAVSGSSGEQVVLDTMGGEHAGAHVAIGATPSNESTVVSTICLDDLVAEYADDQDLLVFKLDIEGQELNAIRASRAVESRAQVLLIYEDEDDKSVTRYLIDRGFTVLFPEEDQPVIEVTSVEHAMTIRRRKNIECEFVATRDASIATLLKNGR